MNARRGAINIRERLRRDALVIDSRWFSFTKASAGGVNRRLLACGFARVVAVLFPSKSETQTSGQNKALLPMLVLVAPLQLPRVGRKADGVVPVQIFFLGYDVHSGIMDNNRFLYYEAE